eukprot:SAG11_NODE_17653_length_512_cov_1.353511_1_plen_59_part_10
MSQAQQNFIIEVETADRGATYLWTGDRWMQSPDGTKAHEPQFWAGERCQSRLMWVSYVR